MARLTAFSSFQSELSFPRMAVIDAAMTFTTPFRLHETTYASQFEIAARTEADIRFIIAIGSNTVLTADDANQTTVGTGNGLYLYSTDGSVRTLLLAVENTSFDAATLVQNIKSLPDDYSGALILEFLLAGNDRMTFGNSRAIAHGYGGNDTMIGGTAIDYLSGDSGRDSLSGGADNDTLDGGSGKDTLVGGVGDDTFIITAGDSVVERSGGGKDTVRATHSFTLGGHIEYGILDEGTKALVLTGNSAANALSGNAQRNTLNGLDGNDALFGNGGRDTMKGGNGRDTLLGEAGGDQLYGGAGRDVFKFASLDGAGANRDTIHDFARGDIIDIQFLGTTELSASAGANTAWLTRQSGGTLISVDYSGDAVAEVEIFVRGSYRLTASDFDFA